MANGNKGNKVDLETFKKWGKDGVIGFKTIEENSRRYVNFVWCKVCARNKDSLIAHPNCKGSIKKAVKAYIDGTNYVTKHNVTRHLEGDGHRIALSIEKSRPENERVAILPSSSGSVVSFSTSFILFLAEDPSLGTLILMLCTRRGIFSM